MNIPSISIIIPIYNGEKYINSCMELLLKQPFGDFEVILVNDGSNDNTKSICDYYSNIDNRVKVFHKKNEGAGPARNLGIEKSVGKYIMFLDCDDSFNISFIEKMYCKIEKDNVDMVICGHADVDFDNEIEIKRSDILPGKMRFNSNKEIKENYILLRKKRVADVLWNKIYRMDVIKENNIRFPDLRRGQDTIFNIKFYEKCRSISTLNEALYYYRTNDFKTSWLKFPKNHYEIINTESCIVIDTLKQWGVYNEEAEKFQSKHFLEAVIGCFYSAYNPKWKFSFKDRYKYIKDITLKEKVKICANKISGEKLFEKFIIRSIRSNNIIIIMFLIKVKIIRYRLKVSR